MKKFLLFFTFMILFSLIFPQRDQMGMGHISESDFGYGYCGGYGHRWMQRNLPTEFYRKYEDMITQNREKIENLYDEKYDVSEQIRTELEKRNPDWDEVENLMNRQKDINDQIWKIMMEENLRIYKNLPYEERKMLNKTYRKNYRQDYMHHR
ncbi:MAG: hypothetical protein FXF47_05530 [Candidatus Mcinerneyibacterium aminivorans]|uniref:Periplasmic heavy metal sensor n=1 Tax=Candidatus Mcinerneyibacterium aminivorans TaxID=2703815 RepID=A0A5D0MFG8_9BACT|nr:MAG: hypothetical protein FXF47_05530 [Candidatus Mcinerneyibacterium aminivorans]